MPQNHVLLKIKWRWKENSAFHLLRLLDGFLAKSYDEWYEKEGRLLSMDEAKASWNTLYQSKEGFECQITLRDEDEVNLIQRAKRVMANIVKSGGLPVKRKGSEVGNAVTGEKEEVPQDKWGKTYVDEKSVRQCNLKLKNSKVCGPGDRTGGEIRTLLELSKLQGARYLNVKT